MINPIFLNRFDENAFSEFIQGFIPSLSFDKKQPEIRTGFKSIQQIAENNGKSLDLVVFVAKLESSLHARVEITKNTYAVLKSHSRSNALVAYFSDDSSEWRLSLITTKVTRTKEGIKESVSNPRRFSYVLGPSAKVATPSKMLQGIASSVEELENKFSLEIVTKEFFENYKKLFDRLVAYLNKDHSFQAFALKGGTSTSNFAKKLLGQIVFLYFLQRKGWLGAKKGESISQGNKDFIRSLFNKSRSDKKNFYNSYLEPLFYGALNTPSEKAGSYYRSYFDCQIPFLNGGLFEPPQNYDWENEFLVLPDKLFSKDPINATNGDGVLDVFDLYNFTVDESDHLDREVSVDPEMLGMVFENLLEENLRKGKGTYYTPREIVHHMCQESLISYLTSEVQTTNEENIRSLIHFGEFNLKETTRMMALNSINVNKIDDALTKIKVVDPACGSGAFLIGMLQEIVKARIHLSYFQKRVVSEYELKKETIQNCVYGVDIDPGAIEIAKLRLWLSLVVDYNLEDIEPLPNLDYKIMVGNSLIEKLDTKFLAKGADGNKNVLIDQLTKLKEKYFSTAEPKEKPKLQAQINDLIRLLVNYDNERERNAIWSQILDKKNQLKMFTYDGEQQSFGNINSYTKKLDGLKDLTETDHFEWRLNFNEVFQNDGFDIVIANPPYINVFELSKNAGFDKDVYRSTYKSASGAFDLYILFHEQCIELTRSRGIITLISPNKYLSAEYAQKLREFIVENTTFIHLVNLSSVKVFNAGVYPIISMYQKMGVDKPIKVAEGFGEVGSIQILGTGEYTQNLIKTSPKLIWSFLISGSIEIYQKLNKHSKITEACTVTASFSVDEAYKIRKLVCNIGDKSSGQTYKKLVISSNIHSYYQTWGDKTISYLKARFLKPVIMLDSVALSKHRLNQINEQKIIIAGMTKDLRAFLDENGEFAATIPTVILTNFKTNSKYLLGLINSKLYNYYYHLLFGSLSLAGGYLRIGVPQISALPFLKTDKETEDSIVKSVEDIIKKAMLHDSQQKIETLAVIKNYKKNIDKIVYKIYDLSPEEISIVENNTPQN